MAAENMNICEEDEPVRVGVVLTTNPEQKSCVVACEGGLQVDYKSAKDEPAKTFSFDQVVAVDDIQGLFPGLLQPLADFISRGYKGALLMCGASTETSRSLIHQSVIRQILTDLFRCLASRAHGDLLITVSFLQFYPDGSTVDLLSLNKQTVHLLTHPELGNVVEGLCEVCVCSAEEAFTLYETCREATTTNAGAIFNRCSSLFSVAVEWKLHPEALESDVCRSRLQLFSLAGGASRTDLRGVSPLLKVLDQIPHTATGGPHLLPSLLQEALTGNSKTFLIYHINPQGVLDDEARCALELAHRVRNLETKAAVERWSPRAARQEIRDSIAELRGVIMSPGGSEGHSVCRLADLTQKLQIVKNQSWEKRREESEKRKVQMKNSKSSNSSSHVSGDRPSDHIECAETTKHLQDQLRKEMEEHIKEGRGAMERVHGRITRIQQVKEALREETMRSEAAAGKTPHRQQSQLEHNKAQERRRQLKEDHGRLIQEEVEKMERDLAQEELATEGPQRELLVLSGERRVLVLQVEALRAEAQQAEGDLQDQHNRHQAELHCLREESLQVFRVFRQVTEEQRKVAESRYRGVLLEAVQDAIYLSAQNQQLQADNKQLRKAMGELKDALAVRGGAPADLMSQQQ